MDFRIQLTACKRIVLAFAIAIGIGSMFALELSACAPQGKLARARGNTNHKAKLEPKQEVAKKKKPSRSHSNDDHASSRSSSRPSKKSDGGKLFAVSSSVRESDSHESEHHHEPRDRDRNRDRDRDRNRDHDSHRNHRNRSRRNFAPLRPFRSAPTFLAFNSGPPVVHTVVEHHEYIPAPAPFYEPNYAQPLPVEPVQQVGTDLLEANPTSVVTSSVVAPAVANFDWFHDWLTQFDANIGSDFDGLENVGFGLRFQIPESLGMDTDVTFFRESTGAIRDHLWLGDWNLTFEPIVTTNVRFRIGAGFNWLADSIGSDFGFNLTSSLDCRLNQNWILQLEGDVGELGDADYSHGRIQLLRKFGRSALALGYESYDIGGAKINGAFTGLQFRF